MTAPLHALLVAAAFAGVLQPAPAPEAPAGEQPVEAYAQSPANAGAEPVRDGAVLRAFHGEEGVRRLAADFVDINTQDPRIEDIFAATDTVRLKRVLAEQFCYLLGGACSYTGRDMRQTHKGQGLQNADFNAAVENLQKAMDTERVPFRMQNVLLAKLAPMQRVVVERKAPAALKAWGRRLASVGHGQ